MAQCFGQQRQAEAKADESRRPQCLDGPGQVGNRRCAVNQRLRACGQQCQPAQHPGQIFERVAEAHHGEGHCVGGVAVILRLGQRGIGGGRDRLVPLAINKLVLVDDAGQDKDDEQQHQKPGAGVAQGAVAHKKGQHSAGGGQQQALAAKLLPVGHHGLAVDPQQAERQRQPHVGNGTGQRRADGQAGDAHTGGQKCQHQLRQRQTKRRDRAAHDPHGQAQQGTAPGGAAPRQPAADGRQQQPQHVQPQCYNQHRHNFTVQKLQKKRRFLRHRFCGYNQ